MSGNKKKKLMGGMGWGGVGWESGTGFQKTMNDLVHPGVVGWGKTPYDQRKGGLVVEWRFNKKNK